MFKPRPGYLWVIFSLLAWNSTVIKRRLNKAVKLSAGCIKVILLLLRDLRPDERASLFFKKIEGHFLNGFATKRWIIIKTSYHLATKHPHMVAMTS